MSPKVTVYIATHNYGCYLKQAIDSVLRQNFRDFELLVFDDGSTDQTPEVLAGYANTPRMQVHRQEHSGLAKSANRALALARGEYIVRLDADDYLDESFLLVLATTLDARHDIGLVYPDYYEVDEAGEVIALYRRKRLEEEAQLLDLPSHGACTMYRTAILRQLGGYWEDMPRQDGLGVWVRFIQAHRPLNVNLPLFYYRQHPTSQTTYQQRVHAARAAILERFIGEAGRPSSVGIVMPVRGVSDVEPQLPCKLVGGRPLVYHALSAAVEAGLGPVAVVTEDEETARLCATQSGVGVVRRSSSLGSVGAPLTPSLELVMDHWCAQGIPKPDFLGVVFYTSPMTSARHLRQAAHTLLTFHCDSVVSVRENPRLHYIHEDRGLVPLFKRRGLKHERDELYEESGAFIFSRREIMLAGESLGHKVGHVVLADDEAVDIEDSFTLWLAERLLERRGQPGLLENRRMHRGY